MQLLNECIALRKTLCIIIIIKFCKLWFEESETLDMTTHTTTTSELKLHLIGHCLLCIQTRIRRTNSRTNARRVKMQRLHNQVQCVFSVICCLARIEEMHKTERHTAFKKNNTRSPVCPSVCVYDVGVVLVFPSAKIASNTRRKHGKPEANGYFLIKATAALVCHVLLLFASFTFQISNFMSLTVLAVLFTRRAFVVEIKQKNKSTSNLSF